VLYLSPQSLAEIEENVRAVGAATGSSAEADRLIANGHARLERVVSVARTLPTRRVFFMEWVEPVFCGGHWVPEMVALAGGHDALSRPGADSVRIAWDDVRAWAPEVFIVSPCGFNLEQALVQLPRLVDLPGWSDLPAVRDGRAYAVDANSYFARPGPRVWEGTELLAHLIHPEAFQWTGRDDAYAELPGPEPRRSHSTTTRPVIFG
jgi:iron complex transport system substrate-binding protein